MYRVVTYFRYKNPAVSMNGQIGHNAPNYRSTLEAAVEVARKEKDYIDRISDVEYVKTDITEWAFVRNIPVKI